MPYVRIPGKGLFHFPEGMPDEEVRQRLMVAVPEAFPEASAGEIGGYLADRFVPAFEQRIGGGRMLIGERPESSSRQIQRGMQMSQEGGIANRIFGAADLLSGLQSKAALGILGIDQEGGAEMAEAGKAQEAEARQEMQQLRQGVHTHPGSWKELALESGEVIEDMVPAIAGGVATGTGPIGTLALMGAQATAQSYPGRRQAGEDSLEAGVGAGVTGSIETLTEIVPMKKLFQFGQPVIQKLLTVTVGEGLSEMASEMLQAAYDKGTIDPDMTFSEAWDRAVHAFKLGMIAGGTLSGGSIGVEKVINAYDARQQARSFGDPNLQPAEQTAIEAGLPVNRQSVEGNLINGLNASFESPVMGHAPDMQAGWDLGATVMAQKLGEESDILRQEEEITAAYEIQDQLQRQQVDKFFDMQDMDQPANQRQAEVDSAYQLRDNALGYDYTLAEQQRQGELGTFQQGVDELAQREDNALQVAMKEAQAEQPDFFDRLHARAEDARKDLDQRLGRISGNPFLDPDVYKDIALIGADMIVQGYKTLPQFKARLVELYGEEIAPHAEMLFKEAKQIFRSRVGMVQDMSTRMVKGKLAGAPEGTLYSDPLGVGAVTNLAGKAIRKVFGPKQFTMNEESLKDAVLRRMQDKFRRVKVLQDTLTAMGQDISVDADIYTKEEQYPGKVEDGLDRLDSDYVKPLVDKLARSKISLEELDEFVYAAHANERNALVDYRRPDFVEDEIDGSGMSTEDANAILRKWRSDSRFNDMKELARMVYAINEHRLDTLQDRGLSTPEEIAGWSRMFRYYVPLKGHPSEGVELGRGVGRGFAATKRESQRIKGRISRAESPVMHSIMQAQEAIIKAEKTVVGRSLLKLVQEYPDPQLWEIVTPQTRPMPMMNATTGQYDMKPDPMLAMRNSEADVAAGRGVFPVKVGGQQVLINIKDPLLYRAMANMGVDNAGKITQGLMKINRFLAAVNTSYNPGFVLTNFARDIQTALYNISAHKGGKSRLANKDPMVLKVAKDVMPAIAGIRSYLRDGGTGAWAQEFEEFKAAGAKIGFFGLDTLEQQQKDILNQIRDAEGGVRAMTRKGGMAIAQFVEDYNTAVENGVRLAAYKNARDLMLKDGKSEQEAIQKAATIAKNLTVNFNRKGEVGAAMNALYLFYNAGLQGTMTMLHAAKTNRGKAILGGLVASGFMNSMLQHMLAGDDDDGQNRYDKIPDHVRKRNMIFFIPGADKPLMIPLPYGYNIPYVMGDQVAGSVFGTIKPTRAAANVIDTLFEAFNPMGTADSNTVAGWLTKLASPTVTDLGFELALNEKFSAAPIHPQEYPGGATTVKSEKSFKKTGESFKAMAKAMNEIGGGNPGKSSWLDVYPDDLEHIFEFVTGSAGRMVKNTLEVGGKLAAGESFEDIPTNTVPFMRRFVYEKPEYIDQGLYYERTQEVQDLVQEHKFYLDSTDPKYKERLKDFERAYPWLMDMEDLRKGTDSYLRKINKAMRDVRVDGSLSKEERQAKLDKMQADKEKVYLDFKTEYNRVTKKNQKREAPIDPFTAVNL